MSLVDDLKNMKPMAEYQFGICKTMQKIGIKAEIFARSCKEPVAKMKSAWSAENYETYLAGLNLTDEMMHEFFHGNGR